MSEARTCVISGETKWYWAWINGLQWQSKLFHTKETCEFEGKKIETKQRNGKNG